MSRNIVPRVNKGADLGTQAKNWNKLYTDAVVLRGSDLKSLLDGKVDLDTLTAKGDLYVATDAGVITRLPAGTDGYVLKTNSGDPKGLIWGPAGARQELTEDITVTVGSGGNFSTINAALENIVSLYYPKYISGWNCPKVTINLLSGFTMNEQVLVESLDLSWITITGDDTETIINRSALTINVGGQIPAFWVNNGGFLPIINQLFNMNTSGSAEGKHGIAVWNNSKVIVNGNCGIKNAGAYGIYADGGSIISAGNSNVSGAGIHGIYANNGSVVSATNSNVSGAGAHGIYASNGSVVSAIDSNASDTGGYGFYVINGSIISARHATGTRSQADNTLTVQGIIFYQAP